MSYTIPSVLGSDKFSRFPGYKELYEDLHEVAPKWQTFGVHLKVPMNKIKVIKGGDGMVESCFTSVLDSWLSGEGERTIDQLVLALQFPGVDKRRLAMEINENRAEVQLDLPYLSEKLNCCKANWFLLGLGLGLKEADLKRFESEKSSNDVEICLSNLLIYWLNSGKANIDVLVGALENVNHRVLAMKIKEKYTGRTFAASGAHKKEGKESSSGDQPDVGSPSPPAKQEQDTPPNKPQKAKETKLDDVLHTQLEMGDHFDVTLYLSDMNNDQIIKLGGALGLHYPKLKRMEHMPDEMVAAWLLRQDSVLKKSGEPTYEVLAHALERIGHKGLAQDVREQKHVKQLQK